ncbi:MAG: putative coagulation factor 5/8 type domain protein, partial [Thermoleophilia bacterium]|nr:putative coagulation factor 5/8 type domain protein [Thermoleophilia bacterium]
PARPRRAPRRERSPRETRARLLAWSMVVAPLVAVVLFGIMIAGERGKEQVDRKPSEGGGPTELVSVASATSFDPKPGGDGEEHEVEAANAIDDDPDSSWTTEGYDLDNFNGTKPGAGLILDLGAPRDVRDVAILTDLPNWRVEVRSATTPATTLAGWKQRSKVVSVRGGQRIAVDMHGHPARYILLWVTKLALDPDDANKSRARIDGVRVFATKGDGSGAPGSTVATVG